MKNTAVVILWLIGALFSYHFMSWFIPAVNSFHDKQFALLCQERWGQSKLRWKYVNHICYVEIEDGFIPDWHYKSGRIR